MSFLIKPVIVLLPVVLFPFVVWMISRKGYPKKIILTFLIPFVICGAMISRNYVLTGVAEYSSVTRKLLINYNIYELLASQSGEATAYYKVDSVQRAVSGFMYRDKVKAIDDFIYEEIRKAPIQYAQLHLKGFVKFFLDTGRWEWRRFFKLDLDTWKDFDSSNSIKGYIHQWSTAALLYQLYCLLMNLILVYAMFRFAMNRANDVRDRRLLLGIVLYLAIVTGPSASARFRIPVFPLQLIAWGALVALRPGQRSSTTHNY